MSCTSLGQCLCGADDCRSCRPQHGEPEWECDNCSRTYGRPDFDTCELCDGCDSCCCCCWECENTESNCTCDDCGECGKYIDDCTCIDAGIEPGDDREERKVTGACATEMAKAALGIK